MGKARRLAKSATGAQKVLTVNDTAGEDYYGNKDNVLLDVQASKKVSVGSAEPHVARLTARQRKKLVKVVEKKKKKKERAGLIQSLADSQLSADQMVLFQRSAQMGRNKETKRELAKRTELEAQNLPVMVGVQKNVIEVINTDTTDKKSKKRKRASAVTGNGEKTEEAMEKQRRKKARRKAAKEEAKAQKAKEDQEMGRAAPVMSFLAFAEAEQAKRDSDESDSDTDSDSGTESGTGSESETGDESEEEGSKAAEQDDNAEAEDTTVSTLGPIAYKESHLTLTRVKRDANEVVDAATFVSLNRDPEIQAQRLQLPILGEEQRVMETIRETPIVILCGETGSGKTTQVPQFLYEAGFGSGKGDYPGLIGVTEPRRVAAISMSERVGKEMGQPSLSGFQVRYSGDCTEATKLKFMTDGVLLKEIERDFLINKYSAIIIDEAHERTLNTDILIGLLSRIVPLRNKLAQEYKEKIAQSTRGQRGAFKRANEAVYPIRLVIMSATLRVEDFTMNTRIFPTPPPVVEIASRQFPVTIHFNRKTPHENYIQEALKKTSKIHEKLPPGGILVFVTSQAEVTQMVTKLKKKYSRTKQTAPATSTPGGQNATDTKGGAETVEMEMDGGTSAESGKKATKATDTSGELSGESGSEDEDDPNMAIGAISAGPLHVLPLYAMLPQAQQMRVFEQPPEGARLCVIATNVAETSLTIPNIKYVVDTGKVKTKRHETAAAISKFEIEWTSQAAANQRAGRAGRTGPGHTYRIFSSAVYNNYFEKFSDPEVLRLPIEGVLLQMKAMGIDNVINFPFPTPPDHEGLMAAERLLTRLNCLDDKGKITAIGRKVSNFPLAPRFSRMLVTALDLGGQCVPYVIAICAALTVGNVFYASMIENSDDEEENTDEPQRPRRRDSDDEGPSKKQQALLDEQSILRNEAEKSKSANRAKTRKIKQRWIGSNPKSDLLTILKAVGAYEHTYETAYASVHNDQTQTEGKRRKKQKQSDRVLGDKVIAGSTLAFCESNLLNYKSMEEIRKLRQQLSKLVREHVQQNAGGHSKVKKRSKVDYGAPLRPPTGELQKQLWQAILSAYGDHVAKRVVPSSRTTSGTDEDIKRMRFAYTCEAAMSVGLGGVNGTDAPQLKSGHSIDGHDTMMNASGIVYVHPESCLSSSLPDLVVFTELMAGSSKHSKLFMKGVTSVKPEWLPVMVPHMCSFSKPLEQPAPRYDAKTDQVKCHMSSAFGKIRPFPLPGLEEYPYPTDNTDRFKVFARALLNGEVFPHLKALIPHLNASPAMVTKGWAQERVVALIGVLARENVCTKADMSDKLRTDTNWLLQVYALWVKKPAQDELVKIWGDLLDYDAGLVYAENDQAEAPSRRGRMQSSSDDDSASD